MPYLNLQTNVTLINDQCSQLTQKLSQLLVEATGKPERYVLVSVEENKNMRFGGSNLPLAYLECKSIGLTTTQAKKISSEVAKQLFGELQIPADRIYIEFSDCAPEFWGWNGSTFG